MPLLNPNWFRKEKANLTKDGREIPDPTPMAPPVGFRAAPSLSEQIREMVRSERLAREAAEAGYETFEEADDFDVEDDAPDPSTPFEQFFEGDSVAAMKARKLAADAAPPQPSPAPSAPATEPTPSATQQEPAKQGE